MQRGKKHTDCLAGGMDGDGQMCGTVSLRRCSGYVMCEKSRRMGNGISDVVICFGRRGGWLVDWDGEAAVGADRGVLNGWGGRH